MRIARVIDFETTGTPETPGAEIIEFGSADVMLDTKQICHLWSYLAKPSGEIPAITKAVHHITEEDVAGARAANEIWPEFLNECEADDLLVAHNAAFEQHFFDGGGRPWVDTYKVARVVWPDAPSHSNQALRYWLDLPVDRDLASPSHRAGPDAYVTAHLFVRLLDEKTIDEMIHISKYPALLKIMNFGKHKGTTFAEAPIDYLEWIRDKSDLDADTKFTARYWVAKRTTSQDGS